VSLFYSQSYLIDRRIILLKLNCSGRTNKDHVKKALMCDNSVIQTLAAINRSNVGLILSKYLNYQHQCHGIKQSVWKHFVDAAHDYGQIFFC